jgi:hypothetical protein
LSFGWAAPKVILHVYDPITLAARRQQAAVDAAIKQSPAAALAAIAAASSSSANAAAMPMPARSALPRYVKLAFRGEPPAQFVHHLNSSIAAGVFRSSTSYTAAAASAAASSSSSSSAPSSLLPSSLPDAQFATSRAGIGGIERAARQRERAIDIALEQAFSDLDALMQHAATVVQLANKMAAAQGNAAAAGGSKDADASRSSEFNNILLDMGIQNPVTKQMAGAEYHIQLAKEMAEFLPPIMQREGQSSRDGIAENSVV